MGCIIMHGIYKLIRSETLSAKWPVQERKLTSISWDVMLNHPSYLRRFCTRDTGISRYNPSPHSNRRRREGLPSCPAICLSPSFRAIIKRGKPLNDQSPFSNIPVNIVCNKYVIIASKRRFDVMLKCLLRTMFADVPRVFDYINPKHPRSMM